MKRDQGIRHQHISRFMPLISAKLRATVCRPRESSIAQSVYSGYCTYLIVVWFSHHVATLVREIGNSIRISTVPFPPPHFLPLREWIYKEKSRLERKVSVCKDLVFLPSDYNIGKIFIFTRFEKKKVWQNRKILSHFLFILLFDRVSEHFLSLLLWALPVVFLLSEQFLVPHNTRWTDHCVFPDGAAVSDRGYRFQ